MKFISRELLQIYSVHYDRNVNKQIEMECIIFVYIQSHSSQKSFTLNGYSYSVHIFPVFRYISDWGFRNIWEILINKIVSLLYSKEKVLNSSSVGFTMHRIGQVGSNLLRRKLCIEKVNLPWFTPIMLGGVSYGRDHFNLRCQLLHFDVRILKCIRFRCAKKL